MLYTQSQPAEVQQPVQSFAEYFNYWEAIDRKNAIEEGLLVDVSQQAKSVFNVPVAMTRSVWDLVESRHFKDEFSKQWRIQSILVQAKVAAKKSNPGAKSTAFDIKVFSKPNQTRVRLWLQIEIEENRPVLTIMTDYEQHLLEVLS